MSRRRRQWPEFSEATCRRAARVIRSGCCDGSEVRRFEREFGEWLDGGETAAVAVSCGTSALETAFVALGIGRGDEVICPSYSFIASSFSIMLAGAQPVFCDVGLDHLIDISKAERLVNRRTKAVLVVHLYGIVADMAPVLRFARGHGLKVVEDCAQCLGGVYRGRKVGTLGDAGCFSFCQTKHITSGGEGGMVAVRDETLAGRCREYREWCGCRMTDVQAAIGGSELSRFDRWNLPRRRTLGLALTDALRNHPLIAGVPPDAPERRNSFWMAPFVLHRRMLRRSAVEFVRAMQSEGAGAYFILWPEMYLEEAYVARRGFGPKDFPFGDPKSRHIDYSRVRCPVAHSLTDSVVGFWTHPTRTLADIASDVRIFSRVAERFSVG